MNIQSFGVVGAGQMGSGIAQTAATSGLQVTLNDREGGFLDRAMRGIESSLKRLSERGTVAPAEVGAILGRIRTSESLDAVGACDFVVEAVNENLDLTYEIAFAQPEIVHGQPVVPLLRQFCQFVENVVDQFVPLL